MGDKDSAPRCRLCRRARIGRRFGRLPAAGLQATRQVPRLKTLLQPNQILTHLQDCIPLFQPGACLCPRCPLPSLHSARAHLSRGSAGRFLGCSMEFTDQTAADAQDGESKQESSAHDAGASGGDQLALLGFTVRPGGGSLAPAEFDVAAPVLAVKQAISSQLDCEPHHVVLRFAGTSECAKGSSPLGWAGCSCNTVQPLPCKLRKCRALLLVPLGLHFQDGRVPGRLPELQSN